ncbi:MAG TPA: glycine cleavage system protein GcvH [Rectinema sp.]|jgi:glycine cleavage system H protein|nr:glycine cleavage system protein GcvH [Spirochaetia bacterium]HAL93644.1 glycine cleavage system protein GcvH [Spirochaetaceae bacterium]HNV19265.1 glycine cleavage system protein GcvH [Rectinema sp.]HNY99129.1 glycine cleavage system protein GcvH [Rectinema sp.]HOD58454.1 glycine cleavage system protein GcvH [Rectinema sp.]
MAIDKNARYLESHEYAKPEGELMVIGISDHAQAELGDVVFVELPNVGKELDKGVVFGTIESVKAASDLYMPISGKVVEVNEEVKNDPSLVNKDCYGSGWLIKVAPTKLSEFESLLDAESYGTSIGEV